MLKRLSVFAMAVALAFATLVVSTPKSVSAACTGPGVTIYAGAGGTGTSKTFCQTDGNIPNLTNVFVQLRLFECGPIHGNDLNDCVTSARYFENGVDGAVCLDADNNYNGDTLKFQSDVGVVNVPGWLDNRTSSIQFSLSCT